MKIALIGYGAMGKLVHRLAEERGHEIVICMSSGVRAGYTRELRDKSLLTMSLPLTRALECCDVAIDFTTTQAVKENVKACVAAGVPLVEGTTGWNSEQNEIERIVCEGEGSFVFGANFSIGVNLFYRIADYAAELIAKFPEYEAFIEEQHHSRKKDAPSGTALKLKEIVSKHAEPGEIAATRAGHIPGTHRLGFDGATDQVLLQHTARSRDGFASGAILAAEWIVGKKGFYEFTDVMDELLGVETTDKHG